MINTIFASLVYVTSGIGVTDNTVYNGLCEAVEYSQSKTIENPDLTGQEAIYLIKESYNIILQNTDIMPNNDEQILLQTYIFAAILLARGVYLPEESMSKNVELSNMILNNYNFLIEQCGMENIVQILDLTSLTYN